MNGNVLVFVDFFGKEDALRRLDDVPSVFSASRVILARSLIVAPHFKVFIVAVFLHL